MTSRSCCRGFSSGRLGCCACFVLIENLVEHIHLEIITLVVYCVLSWVMEVYFAGLPLMRSTKLGSANFRGESGVSWSININLDLVGVSVCVYDLLLDRQIFYCKGILHEWEHVVSLTVLGAFVNQINGALLSSTTVREFLRPIISVLLIVPRTNHGCSSNLFRICCN